MKYFYSTALLLTLCTSVQAQEVIEEIIPYDGATIQEEVMQHTSEPVESNDPVVFPDEVQEFQGEMPVVDQAVETPLEQSPLFVDPSQIDALEQAALGGNPQVVEWGKDNPPLPAVPLNIIQFDFSRANIRTEQLIETGRTPWEMPVLINPDFTVPFEVEQFMRDDDYVIAVERFGEVKLYPLKIMNWHKGVNDTIGGVNIFVVWDPLSGNATAFERDMRGQTLEFGDSGLVYRSSTVFFDEQTESLWLPILDRAVTGRMAPGLMRKVPVTVTYWKEAKAHYPHALVMSFNTNLKERPNYQKNPYGNYGRDRHLVYPIAYGNDALPRKEMVLGVTLKRAGETVDVALPLNVFHSQASPGKLEFNFETGHHPGSIKIPLNVELSVPKGALKLTSLPEVEIDTQYAYWFSWIGHRPKSFVVTRLP